MLLSVPWSKGEIVLMNIVIDKNINTPIYWQIASQIKSLILTGQLANGFILPSERSLAQVLEIHRNTVIKAYCELKDEQLINSYQGVGYKITFAKGSNQNKENIQKVNWTNLIKDEYLGIEKTYDKIFKRFHGDNIISFAEGMPPPIYSEERIANDLAGIINDGGKTPFFSSPYQGDIMLRQKILSYLRTKGIKAGLSEVQIMSETNQALDFIVTALLKEGDSVITEEPVSPDVYRVIELAGCNVITVPMDDEGMICDYIEPLIIKNNPKFIYVNSSYHDPTGIILSESRRKKLLEISSKYRIPIIEEDAASELSFYNDAPPSIKSMDIAGNVIYIYSFSLTFAPGLATAFIVAPSELVKSLSYLVSIRLISLDWIKQKLLAKYIADGTYYKNTKELCLIYKEKRDIMCNCLDGLKYLGIAYKKPRGGVYIWCKLPSKLDGKSILKLGYQNGISIIPGEVFYPKKNGGQNYIRLNYSYESKEKIVLGMAKLKKALEKALACEIL